MVIDLSSLRTGAPGDSIRVAGICAGEPAVRVDRAALTGAEDNEPGYARTYADRSVFRTAADGTLIEVPLPERVDGTLRRGGFLRCGDIAIRVDAQGNVERIFVRGASLASLGVASQADVERVLGQAEGYARMMGSRYFHYPARRVVVAWSERDDRLEHVALGVDDWQEPRLGAAELLSQLLAAWHLIKADGAVPADGSARVRYQQMAALTRALGLGTPSEVASGAFLPDPLDERRRRVVEELAARSRLGRPTRRDNAELLFTQLIHYRLDVERVVTATAGWLECSDPALLAMIEEQNRIGRALVGLVADVDRWLRLLLDPDGRTFALSELIAHHGWPDVDLHELEMDEW
jgi:hypothetical protein